MNYKCKVCSWTGTRGDLVLDKINSNSNYDNHNHLRHPDTFSTDFSYILNVQNWCYCPNCFNMFPIPRSETVLSLVHRGSVISIVTNNPFHRGPTFLHLGRILDFVVGERNISFLGYKALEHFPFNLNMILSTTPELEFESKIVLKIVHYFHKQHFNCEARDYDDYKLFGRWGIIMKNTYPLRSCSLCARIHDYETKKSNGWPLSVKAIDRIKMDTFKSLANVPLNTNNKFNKIFNPQNIVEKPQICCCNEISKKPNEFCSIHNTADIVGTASPSNLASLNF